MSKSKLVFLACVCVVSMMDVSRSSHISGSSPEASTKITAQPSMAVAPLVRQQRLVSGYGDLPLSFEPVADKSPADAQRRSFLARGRGYTLELSGHEAVLALSGGDGDTSAAPNSAEEPSPPGRGHHLRVQFVGSRSDALGRGEATLPGKVHYLVGNEPVAWRTNIPTYAKVRYEGVYPGIDLVYYGTQGELEYDFVVAPGADPTDIALSFDGADAVQVDNAGDLLLPTPAGMVRQHKPYLYQEVDGERQTVDGRYVVDGPHVRVEVGRYDTSRSLVIDPVLVFSGGVGGASATGVAVDAAGNAYVAGFTHLPSADGESGPHGARDAFVKKINAAGTAVLWTAFIGGSGDDWAYAVAIDAAGSPYVTGSTRSADFPTLNAFDFTYNGPASTTSYGDAFVAKLTPDGATLVYSTYLGSSGDDRGWGIAVRNGHAYVTGQTFRGTGAEFPTTPGAFQAVRPGLHAAAFVTRFDAAGALVSSTFLGSSGGHPTAGRAIAIDAGGNTYVTGAASGGNFPTVNPAQTWSAPMWRSDNAEWAFISKLNPAGTALVYSTYFGGGQPAFDNKGGIGTRGLSIAVDATGSAYVTGETEDVNLPVTAGAFQQSCPFQDGATWIACRDAFVTKLSPNGGTFVYATYLGALQSDYGNGITVDAAGRAHLTGGTSSLNFPVVDAFQPTKGMSGSGDNAFFTVVNPAGTGLEYSTYLGGSDGETGNAVALDTSRNAYVVGTSISSDFPRVGGLPAAGGGHVSRASGFIAKFSAVDCSYAVVPTGTVSAPAAGVTGALSLSTPSGCGWGASSSTSWLTVTPGSGAGPDTVSYTVAPNTSTNPRTGTFTVAGTTVVVQQAGFVAPACTYTVVPTSGISVPAGGIAGTINVTTAAACAWATSATVSWLSVTPATRSGSGAATYTVAPNASTTPRNGTLTVAGTTIAVQQAGVAPGPPTGPPGAPVNVGATVSGSTINLTWGTPTSGAAPTSYTLVGRLTAGGPIAATVPMGAGTSFAVTAPNGTFVLSVRASNADGTGPESTGVTVTVPQAAAPPGAPFNLAAAVTGTTVSLMWSPPSAGGPVANYLLVAGLTPAFSVPYVTVPVGPTPGYIAGGVPAGTYYVRVLAQNASGTSAPSNETVVIVGGCTAPSAPGTLTATVFGANVTLGWEAAIGAPTDYLVEAGLAAGRTDFGPFPAASTGLAATAPSGTYYVRVRARSACGIGPTSNEVIVTVP